MNRTRLVALSALVLVLGLASSVRASSDVCANGECGSCCYDPPCWGLCEELCPGVGEVCIVEENEMCCPGGGYSMWCRHPD
jgi:hypothetical protein